MARDPGWRSNIKTGINQGLQGWLSEVFGINYKHQHAREAFTHEELQSYVVDKDVIQRDDAQLAKTGCQLQGIDLLRERERQDGQNWWRMLQYKR